MNECEVEYRITHKNIKYLRMRVELDNDKLVVKISAPKRVSQRKISEFVAKNQDWLQKTYQKLLANPKHEIYNIQELESLTKQYIFEKCQNISAIKYDDLTIKFRNMKTRWGVCNIEKKKITINTRLRYYPQKCLEYVVVHELVHLVNKPHDKKFWELVALYFPDYKEAKKLLKE